MSQKAKSSTKKTRVKSSVRKRADTPIVSDRALFPVAGIGASAGGLEAVSRLLKYLPDDLGMAYVLIQHLDPTQDSALTEILQRTTRMPVREVTADAALAPNTVYVIPPAKDLVVVDGVLRRHERPAVTRLHHSIDLFLSHWRKTGNSALSGSCFPGRRQMVRWDWERSRS